MYLDNGMWFFDFFQYGGNGEPIYGTAVSPMKFFPFEKDEDESSETTRIPDGFRKPKP